MSGAEEDCNLYIGNLDRNITENEFIDFFRRYEGFLRCYIRKERDQPPMGFVELKDRYSADRVIQHINGRTHDRIGQNLIAKYARDSRKPQREPERTSDPEHSRDYRRDAPTSDYDRRYERGNDQGSSWASRDSQESNRQDNRNESQSLPINAAAWGIPMRLPADATSSLYVVHFPEDATVRELAHIFRQFPGFCDLRIRKSNDSTFCVVEFDNEFQSTVAMLGIQGYKFDVFPDSPTLHVEYMKSQRRSSGGRS